MQACVAPLAELRDMRRENFLSQQNFELAINKVPALYFHYYWRRVGFSLITGRDEKQNSCIIFGVESRRRNSLVRKRKDSKVKIRR